MQQVRHTLIEFESTRTMISHYTQSKHSKLPLGPLLTLNYPLGPILVRVVLKISIHLTMCNYASRNWHGAGILFPPTSHSRSGIPILAPIWATRGKEGTLFPVLWESPLFKKKESIN